MDRRSKILLAVFILVLLGSVFLSYKRAFVDKNFEIIEEEEEIISE